MNKTENKIVMTLTDEMKKKLRIYMALNDISSMSNAINIILNENIDKKLK